MMSTVGFETPGELADCRFIRLTASQRRLRVAFRGKNAGASGLPLNDRWAVGH